MGAGDYNTGHHLLNNLLSKPDQLNISLIADSSSNTRFPDAANIFRLPDSSSHSGYVAALKGQDAVISAVGYVNNLEEITLIAAAGEEAALKRIIPSKNDLNNTWPSAR